MASLITHHVARREFRSFVEIGDAIHLTEDARREALRLSEREWSDWTGLLADGPVPAVPALPEMLQRLGCATYSLFAAAERQGVAA
jgi:hypothetical protein